MGRSNLLSGRITLAHKTRNDACSCILSIKSDAQFLPQCIVLLFEREYFQHRSVPLILESLQENGDG